MIEKGEPDIAPELWTNGLGPLLAPAVAEGRIASAGESIKGGAVEAFWIPKFMLEKNPELATIEGVLANPQFFQILKIQVWALYTDAQLVGTVKLQQVNFTKLSTWQTLVLH